MQSTMQLATGFQEHNQAVTILDECDNRHRNLPARPISMNIYFSLAFNTIDHDKLLCIMHNLGFALGAMERS